MSSKFWTRVAAVGLATSAVFVFAACGSGDDSERGATATVPPTPSVVVSQTITLTMFDDSFEPREITVKGGNTVRFTLPNAGLAPHNMHIASSRGLYRESPWISTPEPIIGGQTGELVWTAPSAPGAYKFRCDYHEVAMIGLIRVE